MAQFTPQEFLATYLAQNNIAALSPREQYIVLGRLQQVLDASAATGTEPTPQRLAVALAGSETIRAQTGINDSQSESLIAALIVSADDTVTYIEENGSVEPPVDPVDPDTPADFTLTKANNKEVINGTAESEVFDATELGSLQDDDIIIDASSTDNDVLNAAVNGSATKSRIQNVETINLKGEYLDVGFDLTNVSGTKTLNLSTKIAGGTGTITNANSMNAAKIVAGENIGTLDVTSLASGTRDTVTVDAGNATKVNLVGKAAGADSYDVKLAENATVALTTYTSAGDKLRLDLAGGKNNELTTGGANTELLLTLNASTADAVVDLTNSTNQAAKTIEITGNKNVTIVTKTGDSLKGFDTAGVLTGIKSLTNTGSGTTTIKVTDSAAGLTAGLNFENIHADVFELAKGAKAAAGTLTLNENTKLNLAGDAAANLTLDIDDGNPLTATFTASTARVDISETQSATLDTGANVKTVLINVTPDETTDTDKDGNGKKESSLTLAELDINASATTTAAVIQGSENLVITTLKIDADNVLAASNLTGNLTLGTITGSAGGDKITIVGGKGNTTISNKTHTGTFDIQLSAGTNSINLKGASDGTKVTATGGTNTITSKDGTTGAGDITIKLADGNDTVFAGTNNTITLGGGNDTVHIAANKADILIKDFVLGTDTLVLDNGVGKAATTDKSIDLSKVGNPTKGAYLIGDTSAGAGVWGITLENGGTGLTATDLRDSVQLNIALDGNNLKVVAGDKNDSITVNADKTGAEITTGGGSDTVTLAVGTATAATVTDFTVGSDKIVVTGAITKELGVNLKNVTPDAGKYTIGDATLGANFTLKNGGQNIVTDGDLTGIVQLGSSDAYFKAENDASAADIVVIGGKFNDYVELTGKANADGDRAIYKFTNDGSVDKVKLATATGAELLDFTGVLNASVATTAKGTAVTAKVGDATDKGVYIFGDSAAGVNGAKIKTMKADAGNGITQADVNAEVAAFINAGLGVSNGEKYVVIIHDNSTDTYAGAGNWGGVARPVSEGSDNAYIYLVEATGDTLGVDNIKLIGTVEQSAALDGNVIA